MEIERGQSKIRRIYVVQNELTQKKSYLTLLAFGG